MADQVGNVGIRASEWRHEASRDPAKGQLQGVVIEDEILVKSHGLLANDNHSESDVPLTAPLGATAKERATSYW